jgi:hypothetical protein
MTPSFIKNIKMVTRSFVEAGTSCSIMMVQANFSAFTLAHLATALSTALYAAIGVFIALIARPESGKFFRAWVTGVITMFADRFIHPGHYGSEMTEAMMTGLGAFVLALIFDLSAPKKDKI